MRARVLAGWVAAWKQVQDAEVRSRQLYDTIVLQRSDAFWLAPAAPVHAFPSSAISYKHCPSQVSGRRPTKMPGGSCEAGNGLRVKGLGSCEGGDGDGAAGRQAVLYLSDAA